MNNTVEKLSLYSNYKMLQIHLNPLLKMHITGN